MRPIALLLLALPVVALAACVPVTGDRILGRDLAAADARFLAWPAELAIGYAPAPGSPRTFTDAELRRLARVNEIGFETTSSGPRADVCFERPLRPPVESDIVEALRRSLPGDASLRVVDFQKSPIPAGHLEFPLTSLEPLAAANEGVQLWRGFVQYSDTRKFPLWARVQITRTYMTVVARRELAADTPVDAKSLQLESRTGPMRHEVFASRIQDVANRSLKRPVKAGAEIAESLLEDPPAVRRGDSVRVEVQSGLAVLWFDAIVQAEARVGEMTELRNPSTGKTFRARISTGSKAVVLVGKGRT